MNDARIHVYYGDGKGKTSAALGLALRAAGQGLRVAVLQFFKGEPTGELTALEALGIRVLRGKPGAAFALDPATLALCRAVHDENLAQLLAWVHSGSCDVAVLDEALDAVTLQALTEEPLRQALGERPRRVEWVLTGHEPVDWILRQADYVTCMEKCKHPFDQGFPARRGIEY